MPTQPVQHHVILAGATAAGTVQPPDLFPVQAAPLSLPHPEKGDRHAASLQLSCSASLWAVNLVASCRPSRTCSTQCTRADYTLPLKAMVLEVLSAPPQARKMPRSLIFCRNCWRIKAAQRRRATQSATARHSIPVCASPRRNVFASSKATAVRAEAKSAATPRTAGSLPLSARIPRRIQPCVAADPASACAFFLFVPAAAGNPAGYVHNYSASPTACRRSGSGPVYPGRIHQRSRPVGVGRTVAAGLSDSPSACVAEPARGSARLTSSWPTTLSRRWNRRA